MIDRRFFDNAGPVPLGQLVAHVGGRLLSEKRLDLALTDIAMLDDASETELCLFVDGRYRAAFDQCKAGAVLVDPSLVHDTAPAPEGPALIAVGDPRLAFAQAAWLFYPKMTYANGFDHSTEVTLGEGCRIHPTAIIGKGATIGARTEIGAHAIIGPNVVMGEDCMIAPNVTVSHAILGNRVHLYPGCTIGVHGFGFVPGPQGLLRVPQLGRALLADDVEVGVCSSIDRGTIGDTVVGRGTKIDNHVQVGHNCRIGQFSVLAGQAGIAGSVQIGDGVLLGGAAHVGDHIKVGSGARLAGGSGVISDVPAGATLAGYPAIPVRDWHRQTVSLRKVIGRDGTEAK